MENGSFLFFRLIVVLIFDVVLDDISEIFLCVEDDSLICLVDDWKTIKFVSFLEGKGWYRDEVHVVVVFG